MTINATNTNYNSNLGISNNNLQNTAKEIPTTAQDFAKDKQEAVKEILGYGVDSEGFFTSDFNEAAGIPKEVKIDSSLGIKHELLSLPILGYYNNVDLVGSAKSFYNAFSKLSTQEQNNLVEKAKDIKYFLDNGKEESLYDVLLEKYSDGKGGLTQNGKLEAFIKMNPNLMVGEKTINLAVVGGNAEYAKFVNKNDNLLGMNILDKGKAGELLRKGINEMSPEEFGKAWEELRKEYQAKYDERLESYQKENQEIEEYNQSLAKQGKGFQPIQVTSKSETYKEADFLKTIDFIQSQQKLEQIMLLFNQKSNNETLDIKSFEKFFKKRKLDIEI